MTTPYSQMSGSESEEFVRRAVWFPDLFHTYEGNITLVCGWAALHVGIFFAIMGIPACSALKTAYEDWTDVQHKNLEIFSGGIARLLILPVTYLSWGCAYTLPRVTGVETHEFSMYSSEFEKSQRRHKVSAGLAILALVIRVYFWARHRPLGWFQLLWHLGTDIPLYVLCYSCASKYFIGCAVTECMIVDYLHKVMHYKNKTEWDEDCQGLADKHLETAKAVDKLWSLKQHGGQVVTIIVFSVFSSLAHAAISKEKHYGAISSYLMSVLLLTIGILTLWPIAVVNDRCCSNLPTRADDDRAIPAVVHTLITKFGKHAAFKAYLEYINCSPPWVRIAGVTITYGAIVTYVVRFAVYVPTLVLFMATLVKYG